MEVFVRLKGDTHKVKTHVKGQTQIIISDDCDFIRATNHSGLLEQERKWCPFSQKRDKIARDKWRFS